MKSLKHYLAENEKTYQFRMRTVHEITDDQLDRLEKFLIKYNVKSVSAPKKTILQTNPRGFGDHGPAEVRIIDIELALPVTTNVLHEEISEALNLPKGIFLIHNRSDNEEFWEENNTAKSEKSSSVLADGEYKDSPKVDHSEYFGNDFVSKFIKELPKSDHNKEYKV